MSILVSDVSLEFFGSALTFSLTSWTQPFQNHSMNSFSVGQLRTVCALVSSLSVDRKTLTAIVTSIPTESASWKRTKRCCGARPFARASNDDERKTHAFRRMFCQTVQGILGTIAQFSIFLAEKIQHMSWLGNPWQPTNKRHACRIRCTF